MPASPSHSSASKHPASSRVNHGKKTRLVRRRGRAVNGIGSDDEIEREIGTDSEPPTDDSSVDSDSESETEPISDHPVKGIHQQHSSSSPPKSLVNEDATSFFTGPGNWSEMVADETANGPADLPVIDFADFDSHEAIGIIPPVAPPVRTVTRAPRPTVSRPAPTTSPITAAEDPVDEPEEPEPLVLASRQPIERQNQRPLTGHLARQAYQQRLETDPSYVPTVGEFWGHDDRLMDKDLRSLSGWWRGRWQGGRGRGRGGFDRGFAARGRGRGAFSGGLPIPPQADPREGPAPNNAPPPVAPVDRAWTHDGFHDMKKKEEARREAEQFLQAQAQRNEARIQMRGARPGFMPARGRGGSQARPWFAMKPEKVWTKEHDKLLYEDPSPKPRHGQGPTIRVKLGKNHVQIVKVPYTPKRPMPSVKGAAKAPEPDDSYVVRLPKRTDKQEKVAEGGLPTPPAEAPTTIPEEPVEDMFTVRPRLVAPDPIPLPEPSAPGLVNGESSTMLKAPDEAVSPPLQDLDASRIARTEEAILRRPSVDEARTLPPLNVNFTPPPVVFSPPIPQLSPSYGSSYGFAPVPLPLPMGVGMSPQGMPYELATGRPVYMYNPSPVPHMGPPGLPFVPGHLRQHSSTASPDFMQARTPPINGFMDPTTGAPIFAPPRHSSRIEIRPPPPEASSEHSGSAKSPNGRRTSGLRTAATTFEPSRPSENGPDSYFPSISVPEDLSLGYEENDQQSMMYAPYQQQQQYYYPDAYPQQYGYHQYVDLSQPYESYPPPNPRQSTVYYQ